MSDDPMFEDEQSHKPLIITIAVLVAAALAGGYYWYGHRSVKPPPTASQEAASPAPPAAEAEPPIEHPVPVASASSQPLPDLNESDKSLSDELATVAGASAVASFVVPENIIRHVVVTVDNLSRQKVAVDKRPLTPAPGTFVAKGDELQATLDDDNFKRYAPLIAALRKVDMQRLAAIYLRFYPLFQKSYQDLGYPTGYFNDRLVKVIDELLATPQVSGPIDLVRPNVLYVFADPSLESRSSGQKVLLRMGPDNAAVVKEKLAELRASITAAPPNPKP